MCVFDFIYWIVLYFTDKTAASIVVGGNGTIINIRETQDPVHTAASLTHVQ